MDIVRSARERARARRPRAAKKRRAERDARLIACQVPLSRSIMLTIRKYSPPFAGPFGTRPSQSPSGSGSGGQSEQVSAARVQVAQAARSLACWPRKLNAALGPHPMQMEHWARAEVAPATRWRDLYKCKSPFAPNLLVGGQFQTFPWKRRNGAIAIQRACSGRTNSARATRIVFFFFFFFCLSSGRPPPARRSPSTAPNSPNGHSRAQADRPSGRAASQTGGRGPSPGSNCAPGEQYDKLSQVINVTCVSPLSRFTRRGLFPCAREPTERPVERAAQL